MNPQDRTHSPQDEDRLLQYLDGQLPATEARAFETHLAACPTCQALRRQWEQLDEKLARALAQPRLSPDFAARLRQRVAVEVTGGAPTAQMQGGAGAEAESQQAWLEARQRVRSLLWLGLLDGVGYGAAAAAGGYLLFRLALAWIPGPAGTGVVVPGGTGFLFGSAIAGAMLLFGLSVATKNKLLRWVGAA